MKGKKIRRKNIIASFTTTLKPLDYVYALWEAGAAAFNRIDEWSDIDLYVVAEDDRVEDTFKAVEQAIRALSDYDLKFRLPEPTWHGHSQVFYRLKKASPFLFVDIVVMKKSSRDKFLQFQIHGEPVIHFDKIGAVKDDTIDPESFFRKIEGRLERLKATFEFFQVLTLKELNRGNDIEALSYYIGYTYRPLVEVLRIKYCPFHYNFYTSYIYYDLPPEVVKRLYKLNFVASAEELHKCRAEAETWFWEVVKSINYDDLKKSIKQKD